MTPTRVGSVLERTVLKDGQLFVVADRDGDIKALNLEGQGLYFRDRRHLSLFEMSINGTRLTLLSSSGELNFISHLQFTNDLLLGADGKVVAEPRTLSIARRRFVSGGMHERIELRNYNSHSVPLVLRFTCGSDFRDMFEVRGFATESDDVVGNVEPIALRPDGMVLSYRGATRRGRKTHIVFDPPPAHIEIVNATLKYLSRAEGPEIDQRDEGLVVPPMAAVQFELDLPPRGERSISLEITPEADGDERPEPSTTTRADTDSSPAHALEAKRAADEDWQSGATHIETDNELFDQLLTRSLLDIRLLVESYAGDLVPTAGIPWFAVPFGRDSLICAMETLSLEPGLARGTLRFLARYQGRQLNPARGEAPGKILHEVRPGVTGAVGDSIFYGSIDSTPLFLVALGEYINWSGDLALARELLPNAEAALDWMREFADPDDDGLIECDRYPASGLGDQGWKDSPDSMNHADGRPADQPVALAEVQAYAFAAHRYMATLYRQLGEADKARRERAAADRIRTLFLERFAIEDEQGGPYWAMGLDAHDKPIAAVTSNPGHALWVGLLCDDHAAVVARQLLKEDMLCGWGIRTLSETAATFNPMSYHNGSVWPHDNALIALGLKRAGFDSGALAVATEIFEAGLHFPASRLPELWCGFRRDGSAGSVPAQYPVACSPQAWAAGSAFMLLQSVLGLEVDALAGVLRLRPSLPTWLGRVSYRRLRVGSGLVDFDVVRQGHRVIVEVIDDGGLRIEAREPKLSA